MSLCLSISVSVCISVSLYVCLSVYLYICALSALTLLVGRQEGHPVCKNEWWGAGVIVCLERGADLHTVQLMPLTLTVSCFSKIQIGFTFLVPAHPRSPGKQPLNWHMCLSVCISVRFCIEFVFACTVLFVSVSQVIGCEDRLRNDL